MVDLPRPTVLVTGANGFVGAAVTTHLRSRAYAVRPGARTPHPGTDQLTAPDLTATADWAPLLASCHAVVHTAARVHVMRDEAPDPLAEFRAVNVDGTLRLARQAAAAGVRRFVFISSIKVNGEQTDPAHPFTAEDAPAPLDSYGRSKAEAEDGLRRLATETGLEVVIVRPPLIYGPGVRGNFRTLIRCLQTRVPLPLGAITDNRRSLLGLDNLVDLIGCCVGHPSASGRTFLASDGEDVSTTDLLRRLARSLRVKPLLLPVPSSALRLAGRLLHREPMVSRLCGSLQVSLDTTRAILGWTPPVSMNEGLGRLAAIEGQP